jgi:alpha-L-rhamnosidase
MAAVAGDLGVVGAEQSWRARAERVRLALRGMFWSDARRSYVDSVERGAQSRAVTAVANGMALLQNVATAEQVPALVECVAAPAEDVVLATPLFHYYAMEGLIAAGAEARAYAQMADYYGPMMRSSDAPTIWEGWVPFVRERGANYGHAFGNGELNSLAHTGGVGPCWTLSKHALGVYPVGRGFRKCRIRPRTGGLDWARGVFPSVRGDIKVSWAKRGGGFLLEVALPEGLDTELCVPRAAGPQPVVTHNGKRVTTGLTLGEDSLSVHVRGGRHRLEVAATG